MIPRNDYVDDINWIVCKRDNWCAVLFETEPFFSRCLSQRFGKLIYSSYQPYGRESESRIGSIYGKLFRVARRHSADGITPVGDYTMQAVGECQGLKPGHGVHAHLSQIPTSLIQEEMSSVPFLERFPTSRAKDIAFEVADYYQVQHDALRLTGGAQIFREALCDLNDIDVVIPIMGYNHASFVFKRIVSSEKSAPVEYGFKSPVRWKTMKGSVVCPFFVYGTPDLPICKVDLLETIKLSISVTLTDCSYSILNMPIYRTVGEVQFLAIRNRSVRGVLVEGDKLEVIGTKVRVRYGIWYGLEGIIVTHPEKEIIGFANYLDRCRA